MKWSNVSLIYCRELRDQLRDRRTLFTVLILPLLLYPLMGISLLQVSQFMREYPTRIWLIGADQLPDSPALLIDQKINPALLDLRTRELLHIETSEDDDSRFRGLIEPFAERPPKAVSEMIERLVRNDMQQRNVDLAVIVPHARDASGAGQANARFQDRILLFRNSASDKSNIAADRFKAALGKWQAEITGSMLRAHQLDPQLLAPVSVIETDVASRKNRSAALWSKVLPLIIVVWCLTGAFYPAVDLCAGEKERGTFETLLSSPARRDEIAIGKLLTVMSFSIITSLLNLISMAFTGFLVASRLGAGMAPAMGIGVPPLACFGWLLLALLPISALFSAVAMAAASFARSSKEGQYYLVPLMMISLPLMMLPMLPAAKLDLGTSLIPVSGLMLMLRGLIEGNYQECIPFAGPVCAVTLIGCWLAVRWVVRQFNSEAVLFRSSERFGIATWAKHVMRERDDLPSIGHALLCGIVILVLKFFVGAMIAAPASWAEFSKQTMIVLIATVGTPAVLMAIVLTRNPLKSLKLQKVRLSWIAAALLLAFCLHPLFTWITSIVLQLYPPTTDMAVTQQLLDTILSGSPGVWAIIVVIAIAPAILEELAFRGFILSGMQSIRSNFKAIILTSILFGVAHAVFQQSIVTFFVGCVLGFIAVRTGSIFPCIAYHAVHNSVFAFITCNGPSLLDGPFGWLFSCNDGTYVAYRFWPSVMLTSLGGMLLLWIWEQSSRRSTTPLASQPHTGREETFTFWTKRTLFP
ncbi:MAG: ABC transporter permease subunit/CPBP intramembrane protease [Planctomycetota bacterium]|nr:ABC transporter permease subunit/CPBP intramembrane protease [Planctomycetota bacterium]